MPAASRTASASSRTRLGPSSASNRMDVDDASGGEGHREQVLDDFDDDDDDDLGGVKSRSGGRSGGRAASASGAKKAAAAAASARKASGTKRGAAKEDTALDLDLDLESDSDRDGGSGKTPAQLEAAVRKLTAERDALAAQFAELQALRTTAQESSLASYKKAAESRFKHSQDLISTLRTRLDVAERRVKAGGGGVIGQQEAEEDATEETQRMKLEIETLKREKKRAEEQAKRLSLELRTETESSRALMSQQQQQQQPRSSDKSASDTAAIRRLYEDLTGLVISRVDDMDAEGEGEGEHTRKKYTAVFTATGHHDLQLSLEESSSSIPSAAATATTTAKAKAKAAQALREDLIFVPDLDPARDAKLLQSGSLPPYLQQEIRFDRGLSVRFLSNLVKSLKM